MRVWLAIALVAGLSACAATDNDPRYQFGVSAEQPAAAPGPQAAALLDWKAGQLCTLGYQVVRQDTMNTETGGQILDNHIQCNVYRPSLDAGGSVLPNFSSPF